MRRATKTFKMVRRKGLAAQIDKEKSELSGEESITGSHFSFRTDDSMKPWRSGRCKEKKKREAMRGTAKLRLAQNLVPLTP